VQIVERSALKNAQFIYFGGMMTALLALVVITWGIGRIVLNMNVEGITPSAVDGWTLAAAAGAIGAIVSVMQRISANECPLRWRAGTWLLFLMGGFRPIVGAVIAVIAVLAIQANLLPDHFTLLVRAHRRQLHSHRS